MRRRRTDPSQLALCFGEDAALELARIANDARRETAILFAQFDYMLPLPRAANDSR